MNQGSDISIRAVKFQAGQNQGNQFKQGKSGQLSVQEGQIRANQGALIESGQPGHPAVILEHQKLFILLMCKKVKKLI